MTKTILLNNRRLLSEQNKPLADGAIEILGTVNSSRGRCSHGDCYLEITRLFVERVRVLFHSGGLERRERGLCTSSYAFILCKYAFLH
jgi:hypothetical protein